MATRSIYRELVLWHEGGPAAELPQEGLALLRVQMQSSSVTLTQKQRILSLRLRVEGPTDVKSSTAGSKHTPHPFYSHLSQSSCVKRRLGHSSSATYGLHSLASNTNPQSSSSYSLRVLSSHHEIFRAPFLIIGLKDCQSSSPARQKLSAKHSRETCFPKSFIPRKTLSLQVATICELPKQVQAQLGPSPTQEKHAPTSSYHFNYFTTTT